MCSSDLFLATLSHELRTPLNSILGWAQVLGGAQNDPAIVSRALDTIIRNAKQQAHLIDDLLDLSRILGGRMRLNMMLDPAGGFAYVRLHGDVRIYTSGYSARALAGWAGRIRLWARDGRDVYVYFDNDVKVRAPFDALALMRRLGLAWEPAGAEDAAMRRRCLASSNSVAQCWVQRLSQRTASPTRQRCR